MKNLINFRKVIYLVLVFNWLILSVAVSFALAESAFDSMVDPDTKKDFIVEKVTRADVILLNTGKKYRLIGLNGPDAPKSKAVKRDNYGIVIEEQSPETTLNDKAFAYAQKLLENKRVRLEFDFENKDENFYTYAYVFLEDGTFVNAEILRQGYASLKITPANTKYAEQLRKAYQDAHNERRGIHGE